MEFKCNHVVITIKRHKKAPLQLSNGAFYMRVKDYPLIVPASATISPV